jgi:hypothetical protein
MVLVPVLRAGYGAMLGNAIASASPASFGVLADSNASVDVATKPVLPAHCPPPLLAVAPKHCLPGNTCRRRRFSALGVVMGKLEGISMQIHECPCALVRKDTFVCLFVFVCACERVRVCFWYGCEDARMYMCVCVCFFFGFARNYVRISYLLQPSASHRLLRTSMSSTSACFLHLTGFPVSAGPKLALFVHVAQRGFTRSMSGASSWCLPAACRGQSGSFTEMSHDRQRKSH